MAKCMICGGKSSFFSNVCDDCSSKQKAQEQLEGQLKAEKARHDKELAEAQLTESQRREAEELFESKHRIVESLIEQAKSGTSLYLHESVYLPVDSVITEQQLAESFDVGPLRNLGWEGWRIVGVIPKTIGVGLTNKSIGSSYGETWGAGLGGNVAGAYVLLELEVNSLRAESLRPTIQSHVERTVGTTT